MTLASKIVFWALILALLWGGLRWFERANLYQPSRQIGLLPSVYGLPYEDVLFQTEDGVVLHGWFLDAAAPLTTTPALEEPSLPVVTGPVRTAAGKPPLLLYFHGNGGNLSHRIQKLRLFRKLGLSVLLFDYRGYGKSRGRPDERGTYADAEAAVRTLSEQFGADPAEVLYYGESLGCGVALETALRVRPKALILDSPFTSVVDMGREIFPFLPVRALVRYRYDNLAKIPGSRAPLLVIHSPGDDVIPFRMGRAVFDAAAEPKAFLQTMGNHNEGFLDTPYWASGLRDFLTKLPGLS